MCEFGSYAFNLAHAVAYAMISYMAAHLKAYHPLEFAVANLRNAADAEQGKQLLRELADEGFEYVPFDPAISKATWSIQKGKIVGGFDSVVGVGPKTAELLMEKREKGGKNWMNDLTDSQRDKLMRADNTPWHQLTYFQRTYTKLYEDPENYISPVTPAGVSRPVYLIKDIPAAKGKYRFLGRIVRKIVKDKNSPEQLAKRGGERLNSNTTFVNLIFADDTGEIGTTINRFKVDQFKWLLEAPTEGKDFLIKGDNIRDDGGMRWLFIDAIFEITPPSTGETDVRKEESEAGLEAERGSGAERGAGKRGNRRDAARGVRHGAGDGTGDEPEAGDVRRLRKGAVPRPARPDAHRGRDAKPRVRSGAGKARGAGKAQRARSRRGDG